MIPCVARRRRSTGTDQQPVPGVQLPRFVGGAVGYLSYEAVRAFEPRVGWPAGPDLAIPTRTYMLVDTLLVFDNVSRTIKVVCASEPGTEPDIDDGLRAGKRPGSMTWSHMLRKPCRSTAPRRRAGRNQQSRIAAGSTPIHWSTGRWSRRPGSTSRPATSSRSSSPSGSTSRRRPTRSRSTGRCGRSTPARTCSISTSAITRSSAPRRNCWSGSRTASSPTTRSPAPGRAARRSESTTPTADGAAGRREGARRAHHAGRSRPQRCRAGLEARHGARAAADGDRALLPRHAHRQQCRGRHPRRTSARSTPSAPASRPAPSPARRKFGRWRSSPSWRSTGAASTPARSATSASTARWTPASPCARSSIKDGVASLQAGGGIVLDSTPDGEYAECFHKMRALVRAIELAESIESRGGSAMILLIDNYDSFTYNLYQFLAELGAEVEVVAQRQDHCRRDRGAAPRVRSDRDLARTLHAGRGGHLCPVDPATWPGRSRSSASAWDTSRSARHSAARSSARRRFCTARRRRFITAAAASLPACPIRSRRPATIR